MGRKRGEGNELRESAERWRDCFCVLQLGTIECGQNSDWKISISLSGGDSETIHTRLSIELVPGTPLDHQRKHLHAYYMSEEPQLVLLKDTPLVRR